MKGLILKDLYLLKKYCRGFLIVIAAFLAAMMFSNSQNEGLFYSLYPCIFCSMVPITLLVYDERSRWNQYSAVMPYTKAQLVSSKYIIGLIVQAAVIPLIAALQAVSMVRRGEFVFGDYMTMLFTDIVISFIIPSVCLPLVFKYGTEKGRIIYFIIVAVLSSAVTAVNLIKIEKQVTISFSGFMPFIVLAAVGIYVLSWYLSIVFYKKRED